MCLRAKTVVFLIGLGMAAGIYSPSSVGDLWLGHPNLQRHCKLQIQNHQLAMRCQYSKQGSTILASRQTAPTIPVLPLDFKGAGSCLRWVLNIASQAGNSAFRSLQVLTTRFKPIHQTNQYKPRQSICRLVGYKFPFFCDAICSNSSVSGRALPNPVQS